MLPFCLDFYAAREGSAVALMSGRISWKRLLISSGRRRVHLAFAVGLVGLFTLVLASGETYLRFFPPRDFQPYLGNASPLEGPFKADPNFGVQYRSYEEFFRDNDYRMGHYEPLIEDESRAPLWAFFGSSFVHMGGMLGDTTRRTITDRLVFYLGRNEMLPVRLAQAKVLLENGIRPERVLIVLIPLDFLPFTEHAVDQYFANDKGALTYRPKQPAGWLGSILDHSRLALIAWTRGNRHHAIPSFNRSTLGSGLIEPVLVDVKRIFGALADLTKSHGVPVTVILLPNYEHIIKKDRRGFQAQLTPIFEGFGFDVCDPSDVLLAVPDDRKKELFLPDKHFTPFGNELLLRRLIQHLYSIGAYPKTLDAEGPAS